eukprot:scaffold19095_cov42-Attheya_sp.AAC.2
MAAADRPQLEAASTDVAPSLSSLPSPKLGTAAVSSTATPLVEPPTPFSQPSKPVKPLPVEDEVVASEPLPTEDELLASTTKVDDFDGEESFTTATPVVELPTPPKPPSQPVESLPVEDEVLASAKTFVNVQREESVSATKNDYDESLVEPVEILNDNDDDNNLDEKGKQSLPTDESIFNLMQQRNVGAQVVVEVAEDPVALQHALKLRQQHEEDMEKIRRKYAEDQAKQLPTLHRRSRVKEQVGKEWIRRRTEELKEQEAEAEQEEEPPQTTETPKSAELKKLQADQEWVRKRTQEIKADQPHENGGSPPPTMKRKTSASAMKSSSLSRSTSSRESSLDRKEERAQRILDQQRSDMDMVRQYVKDKEQNQLKEQISKVITSPRERRSSSSQDSASNIDTEDNEEEEVISSTKRQEIEMANLLDEILGEDVVEDTIVETPKPKTSFFSRRGGKGKISVPSREDPKTGGDRKEIKTSFSLPRVVKKKDRQKFSIALWPKDRDGVSGKDPPSTPKTTGRDKKKFKSGVYMTNVEKGCVGGQKVEVVRKMSPRTNCFARRKRLVVAAILLFIGQQTLRTILTRCFLL